MAAEKPVDHRELAKHLTGRADDATKRRVEAELDDPESPVNAFLGWLGDPDKHRIAKPTGDRADVSGSAVGTPSNFQGRFGEKPPESNRKR